MLPHVTIAPVVASASSGSVSSTGLGLVPTGPSRRVVLGGLTGGFHYQPGLGDLLIVAKGPGGIDIVLGTYLDPMATAVLASLVPGEAAIVSAAGAVVKLNASGDILLTPAAGRSVLLGGATGAVARSGDAVSVNTTTGLGTITGPGSANVKA